MKIKHGVHNLPAREYRHRTGDWTEERGLSPPLLFWLIKSLFFFYFILNTHKQRTDKLCLIDVANEFSALNEKSKKQL